MRFSKSFIVQGYILLHININSYSAYIFEEMASKNSAYDFYLGLGFYPKQKRGARPTSGVCTPSYSDSVHENMPQNKAVYIDIDCSKFKFLKL